MAKIIFCGMVTTRQNNTVDTQMIKRRESKHIIKENNKFTKEGSRRKTNKETIK